MSEFVEMELMPESSAETSKANEKSKQRIMFEQNVPVNATQPHQPSVPQQKRNTVFQRIDPIFYITSLILSSLLCVGFYFFIEHNNRLIEDHLSEIEASNKEISEKYTHNKHVAPAEPTQEAVPQLISNQPLADVQPQSALPVEAAAASALPTDLPTDWSFDSAVEEHLKIAELQRLLSEKSQQVEYLAIENHELRLRLEFDHIADPASNRSYVTNEYSVEPAGTFAASASELEAEADDIEANTESVSTNTVGRVNLVLQETVVENTESPVERANRAFNDQDYAAAEEWYNFAVQQNPFDRDANFGVASVAIARGNLQLAIDRYRHLLSINPDDQAVFVAMLNLAATENMIETELLNHIARASSSRAALYSVVGHYFGQNGRWYEAQGAFISALGGSLTPPADVLFNLAVSLEHLGQSDEAIEYYKRALEAFDSAGPVDGSDLDRVLVQRHVDKLTR